MGEIRNRNKILRVRNLTYKNILTKVNFDLSQDNIIALMGCNGSGKSTLARLLCGLIEPTEGEVSLWKEGVLIPWDKCFRWQEVALVGQHPQRQTIGSTVEEELSFGLLNLGLNMEQVKEKVLTLLNDMGLGNKLFQSPSTLSGGERQRLVIAAILAIEPSFLILDESFSMLDYLAQERILDLLDSFSETKPMGQIWITHDAELAKQANEIYILDNGELIQAGSLNQVFKDEKLCRLIGIKPDSIERSKGMSLYNKLYSRSKDIYATLNKLNSPDDDNSPTQELIVWDTVSYSNEVHINSSVSKGEFVAIVGPSGAGKTTILEGLAGLRKPIHGKVKVLDESCSIRLIQQEAGEYLIGRTVYDEVFYTMTKKHREEFRIENEKYIKFFGVPEDKIYANPEQLSGGERQNVALCAALESNPQIILFDEPMIGLDMHGREEFLNRLKILKENSTILYVTHNLEEILHLVDRIWLIDKGKIVQDLWLKEKAGDLAFEC